MENEQCICQTQNTLIFSCSGGCNVGQLSNQAAIELTKAGKGKMFCLAGIGGDIDPIVQSTKCVEKRVAIDGCPVGCAKATLEKAGFETAVHVVVTDLGIKKAPTLEFENDDLQTIVGSITDKL